MLRTATIVALVVATAMWGLILVLLLFGRVVRFAAGDVTTGGGGLSFPVLGALVLMLVYFIIFWVIGVIACLAYNLAARWVGGIEGQIESMREGVMYRIRRFGVLRTATVVGVMYAVVVAVILIPLLLIFAAVPGAAGRQGAAAGFAGLLTFGLIGIVVYGIIGWVVTAIACLVYNLVARFVGGIEVQVDRLEPPAPTPGPAGWGAPPGSGHGQGGWGQQPTSWGPPPSGGQEATRWGPTPGEGEDRPGDRPTGGGQQSGGSGSPG